jgi:putative drug exporter of the RND superfamily
VVGAARLSTNFQSPPKESATVRALASWCFRHKWIVIAAWVIAAIGLNVAKSGAGTNYRDNFKLPHTDSFDAIRLLQHNVPRAQGETDHVVIAVKTGRVTEPAVHARVDALLQKLAANPAIGQVISPYAAPGRQISSSGRIAFANVTFAKQSNKISQSKAKAFVKTITSATGGGVEFEVGGQVAEEGNRNNSNSSLIIGFIAAAIVLFLVFGSFPAMLMPLLTAGAALGSGIAVIGLASHAITIANFSSQLALLIGLGVGVDYALFIITRYRQALLRGLSREDSVVEAIDTSGRAVLFAGMIVCIAMLGMFALGVSFLYGVAIAAAVAVSFTVVAALTLGPALLGVFGRLVLRRHERREVAGQQWAESDESPIWASWTQWMRPRAVPVAAAAALVMVVITIPFFGMRLGAADQGSDPTNTTTRKAYDLLAKGFGPGYNGPLQLIAKITEPGQVASFDRVLAAAAATPGVVGSTRALVLPGVHGRAPIAIADLFPKGSPQDVSTENLLHRLRNQVIPRAKAGSGLRVLVGGTTAVYDDFSKILTGKLPLFITIVVGLSFLLLMAVFRSLLIPLTAAVMNLLSAGAAFGICTAVFQHGWASGIFGITKTGPIEAWLPVIVFPIVFGLSMDYEVFLISRMYEEWHRRRDNREAVTHGLAATGRTITAAAAIMVLVFGGFLLGGQRVIQLFGVALGGAVLLDAAIVRSVLVPALMLVLGDRNWEIPEWLDRLLPHLNVEGSSSRRHPPPGGIIDDPIPEPAG